MTHAEATAEVFWTAFRALSRSEQSAVLTRLLKDKRFLEDLVDTAIIEQRRNEPSRPLETYLANKSARKRR